MPLSTITFDTVRKIALALPGVEETTAWGSPVLKVHGKIMAGIPANRSQVKPGSLGVCMDLDDRAELLAKLLQILRLNDCLHSAVGQQSFGRIFCHRSLRQR